MFPFQNLTGVLHVTTERWSILQGNDVSLTLRTDICLRTFFDIRTKKSQTSKRARMNLPCVTVFRVREINCLEPARLVCDDKSVSVVLTSTSLAHSTRCPVSLQVSAVHVSLYI